MSKSNKEVLYAVLSVSCGGINKNFEWRSIYTYGEHLWALWNDSSSGTTYKIKVTANESRKVKFSIDEATTTYTATVDGKVFNENQEFSINVGETILSINIVGPHVGMYKQGYINIHAYVQMININAEIIN